MNKFNVNKIDLWYKIKFYGPFKAFKYALIEMKKYLDGLITKTYSQHQEDLQVDKILNFRDNGFYVDIGAYDPVRFSNTKRFYDRGWHGINIEPDPVRFLKFQKHRPRDINIQIGIAKEEGVLNFYKFKTNTLSTFCQKPRLMLNRV